MTNSANSDKKATMFALTATFFWSTVASAFKIGLESLSPTLFLCLVIIIAWVTLSVALYFSSSNLKNISAKQYKMSIFGGFLNPFLYYLILFTAYERLPAQIAQSLNYTWPIVLVLFSALFLGQKLKPMSLPGMGLSFFGVVIISYGGMNSELQTDFLGMGLAIGSSLIWAGYWIINKKSTLSPLPQIWINFSTGTLLIILYTLFTEPISGLSLTGILAATYSGLFEMAITFILWLKALQLASKSEKISHYIFLSPFLSLIFIYLILKEPILATTIWGLLFIVAGIVIVEYSNASKK
ncbi:MAG: DMT family transporter [Salinivirgaceae bacterium]|jgi:drug/metabolite transporter (DMT)-like permease|nr:DMT family transporter [Salinivirgaceae bacterium]